MMAKVDVKGEDQHPVYAWLTDKNQNGVGDHSVKWNFNKFWSMAKENWWLPSAAEPIRWGKILWHSPRANEPLGFGWLGT